MKVCIWASCAFLYICQISPIYMRLMSNAKLDTLTTIGLGVMIFGILFESIARKILIVFVIGDYIRLSVVLII